MKNKNGKRFCVVSDTHGDMIDPVAEAGFFSWLGDYDPEIRIHAGDAFDFRPIRNGAGPSEKQESMQSDYEAGIGFIGKYFSGGKVRKLLMGNHDQRMWDLRYSDNGSLRDLGDKFCSDIESKLRKKKVDYLPYDARLGVLQIGHLRVIHGYFSGRNAATQHARIYQNCIFGHTHSQEIIPVESLDGPSVAMGAGCLCKIDMHYNARQPNKLRHQQGWVYGVMFDDGTYQAFQAKRIGDKFHAATEFKTY